MPLLQYQALAFVPLVVAAAPPVYVPGQLPDPIFAQNFQYPSIAQPIIVSAPAVETITIDKWQTAWPQPAPRRKRLTQYGINIAIASETIYFDAIAPHSPRPTFIKSRRYLINAFTGERLHIAPPQAEALTLDKWGQPTNRPIFRRPVLRDYGLWVKGAPTPQVPAIFIAGQNTEPFSTINFQYEDAAQPLAISSETVNLDKWFKQTQQSQAVKRQTQFINAQVVRQPDLPQGWQRDTEQLQKRRMFVDARGVVVFGLVAPEDVTSDKWAQPIEQPQRRQRLIHDGNGTFLIIVSAAPETLTLDKWAQANPQPHFVRRQPQGESVLVLTVAAPAESLTLDKWMAANVNPQRTSRFFDYTFAQVGNPITPQGWELPIEQPQGQRKAQQYPALELPRQLEAVSLISLDWQQSAQMIRAARAQGYDQQSLTIIVAAPEAIALDWLVASTEITQPRQWRYLAPARGTDILNKVPAISFVVKQPTKVRLANSGQLNVTITDGGTSTALNNGSTSTTIDS